MMWLERPGDFGQQQLDWFQHTPTAKKNIEALFDRIFPGGGGAFRGGGGGGGVVGRGGVMGRGGGGGGGGAEFPS